jgi:DNA repair exonuclease SbcCD ATPase subunit
MSTATANYPAIKDALADVRDLQAQAAQLNEQAAKLRARCEQIIAHGNDDDGAVRELSDTRARLEILPSKIENLESRIGEALKQLSVLVTSACAAQEKEAKEEIDRAKASIGDKVRNFLSELCGTASDTVINMIIDRSSAVQQAKDAASVAAQRMAECSSLSNIDSLAAAVLQTDPTK